MKKARSPKLTLSRETLRGLDENLLQAPRGGASAGPTNCLTCGEVCQDYTIVTRYNC
jgi:hypothetical protein